MYVRPAELLRYAVPKKRAAPSFAALRLSRQNALHSVRTLSPMYAAAASYIYAKFQFNTVPHRPMTYQGCRSFLCPKSRKEVLFHVKSRKARKRHYCRHPSSFLRSKEYYDRETLWNAVETAEKASARCAAGEEFSVKGVWGCCPIKRKAAPEKVRLF